MFFSSKRLEFLSDVPLLIPNPLHLSSPAALVDPPSPLTRAPRSSSRVYVDDVMVAQSMHRTVLAKHRRHLNGMSVAVGLCLFAWALPKKFRDFMATCCESDEKLRAGIVNLSACGNQLYGRVLLDLI